MRPFRPAALGWVLFATACAASAPTPSAPRTPTTATFAPPDAGTTPPELATDAAADAAAMPSAETADASPPAVDAGSTSTRACNEQQPQDFLVRSNFLKQGQEGMKRAIQYRTDTYGYFKGFGHAGADAPAPSAFLVSTMFMDLPVKMHRKVVPALQCVQEEIKRSCGDHPYTPHALAGVRFRNTYRGGEVTNHIYGIAIDIDPGINTCCGCVKPWNDAPACKRPAKTEYDRMAMPECWVHAFERYGFYWLGHDVLRDTMHFEFLGNPDRIVNGTAEHSLPQGDGGR
jgi:hypothetical protein